MQQRREDDMGSSSLLRGFWGVGFGFLASDSSDSSDIWGTVQRNILGGRFFFFFRCWTLFPSLVLPFVFWFNRNEYPRILLDLKSG